jgi:hypothetical protein
MEILYKGLAAKIIKREEAGKKTEAVEKMEIH